MSTSKTKRVLLATLFAVLVVFSVPSAFAQELPQHASIQTIQPLPAESNSGLPPPDELLDNEFGAAIAIRNGLAVIGMPKTQGTGQVAVFKQGATGTWTRTATIVASDRTEGDQFGRAVSYRDNLLIVGSNRAAYIYKLVSVCGASSRSSRRVRKTTRSSSQARSSTRTASWRSDHSAVGSPVA